MFYLGFSDGGIIEEFRVNEDPFVLKYNLIRSSVVNMTGIGGRRSVLVIVQNDEIIKLTIGYIAFEQSIVRKIWEGR